MSEDGIFQSALECVRVFNAVLCPKVRAVEIEYDSQAADVRHLAKPIDFSYFCQQWTEITESAGLIHKSVSDLLEKINGGAQVESYVMTDLTKLRPVVYKLMDYAAAMQKMMKCLEEKSQGKKYGFMEYNKDHRASERARAVFVDSYMAYKQKS